LRIEDFRCLEEVELEPAAGANFIYGQNASGKTSLLEALFVLGRGRSFRAGRRDVLIREGAAQARVVAEGESGRGVFRAGVAIRPGDSELRVDGRPALGVAEVAARMPVEVIDPDAHRLVAEGPAERRRYLDWSVFHVEPGFLADWRRYQRALRQRTALLRRGAPGRELEPWEQEMADRGGAVDRARERVLAGIAPIVLDLGQHLLGSEIRLTYRPGQSGGSPLADLLAAGRERDARMGQTMTGPHRSDVQVEIHDRRARGRVSRGQQKLVAAAMILGQHRYQAGITGENGIVLMDDISAELDRERVGRLHEALADTPGQLFVTALNQEDLADKPHERMFHVERGNVTAVV
jgi:DNA replication and repair protein RecF